MTKRLKFKLLKHPADDTVLDVSGNTLKMEPLAPVQDLMKYLNRKVAKQWCDYPRPQLHFVRHAKHNAPLTFQHESDFDNKGIIYWIGTNGNTQDSWLNPAKHNLVLVRSSDGRLVRNHPFAY